MALSVVCIIKSYLGGLYSPLYSDWHSEYWSNEDPWGKKKRKLRVKEGCRRETYFHYSRWFRLCAITLLCRLDLRCNASFSQPCWTIVAFLLSTWVALITELKWQGNSHRLVYHIIVSELCGHACSGCLGKVSYSSSSLALDKRSFLVDQCSSLWVNLYQGCSSLRLLWLSISYEDVGVFRVGVLFDLVTAAAARLASRWQRLHNSIWKLRWVCLLYLTRMLQRLANTQPKVFIWIGYL